MGTESTKTADVYDRDAESLAARYESTTFEEVHGDILDLAPDGAGSDRDAAWFAAHGHEVVAVEPAPRMRAFARSLHPDSRIRWLDDQLPALENVFRTGLTFDLIWLSAVWMHVPPTSRQRAFRKMVTLLQPGGRIMMSLRQGPPPDDREMYPTHVDEVEKLARSHGLTVIRVTRANDRLGREGVTWQTVCLQAPDDGLGALPLLRHVIINDSKSSTYKLALLRVLVRIADTATGLVEDVDDETVAVPLGLVALYWIRAFGRLLVPRHLWQAMSRYAAWIEPALLNEWTGLMQSYEGDARRTHDEQFALLRWHEPEHDTRLVRDFALKETDKFYVCAKATYPQGCDQLFGMACARGLKPCSAVIAPGDGGNGLREEMEVHFDTIQSILDPGHLKSHFYETAHELGIDKKLQQAWVNTHRDRLWNNEVETVIANLKNLYQQTKNDRVRRLINYLIRFADAVDYGCFKEKDWPVGSGEVESAHRYVPQERLKIAGACWHPETVNPMLALRVVRANGWWDTFWQWLHVQRAQQRAA